MRAWWIVLAVVAAGCPPPEPYYPGPQPGTRPRAGAPQPPPPTDPAQLGTLEDRVVDFAFDGGQIEFERYRSGSRVVQVARNRYAVPVMIRWALGALDSFEPQSATEGVALLPAAPAPNGAGATVILAELEQLDWGRRYRRPELHRRAKFGDPRAEPTPYVYGLPYPAGLTFTVLQGFHGPFSHRGSNEYAVDFDCPVATPVLAARPGIVVAANAAAQGAGTTQEFNEYRRTNFVLILHDDNTLGEYMHLAPSGIEVAPGQRVERGQPIGLSGNTGFSSTPHLHFQVMTAGDDGVSARSFPFQLAAAPKRVEEPIQGRRYSAWETRRPAR
ncbi:MAG TPA: M23 family metallopeptidase [Kofleriaceae bacterium]|nr:M23 family metallopeptidase [Kofleriaceae bacterium]